MEHLDYDKSGTINLYELDSNGKKSTNNIGCDDGGPRNGDEAPGARNDESYGEISKSATMVSNLFYANKVDRRKLEMWRTRGHMFKGLQVIFLAYFTIDT